MPNSCPIISDKNLTLQLDFRPSLNEFEVLSNEPLFSEYLRTRDEIALIYERKLSGMNVQTIEDVDFGDDD